MLRDVFSEASRIETHNCRIPYSHWHAARVWQSSWWRRRLAQAPADWEFVQARLRRLFHLRSASAQDPHEIEGLPLARRRSACCSQPEGHHGTNNACQLLNMEAWQWCRREPTSRVLVRSPSGAAAVFAWGSAKTRSTSQGQRLWVPIRSRACLTLSVV